jgi:hypothetical protein
MLYLVMMKSLASIRQPRQCEWASGQGMLAWTLEVAGPSHGPCAYRPSMQRREPTTKGSATTPFKEF